MTTIKILLDLLAENGGEIVCTAALDVQDINQARASERMYVDENGIGFVWMPKFERMPQTVEEVKFFEKWWPLDVEMPEELKNPEWLFKALDERRQRKNN
jgi:hypothetical protein